MVPQPPQAKQTFRPRIDTTVLKVDYDVELPKGRSVIGKYDAFYSTLKPRASIQADPKDVSPIANSLRKWLKDKGKDKELRVVAISTGDEKDPTKGRVWLWPANEAAPTGGDKRTGNKNRLGKKAS